MQKSRTMIEDTEWWEKFWADKGFRETFKAHERVIKQALVGEMCANKDKLNEG